MNKKLSKKWTDDEVKLLRENYNKTFGELMNLLPKRTKKAIEEKIRKLNLPRTKLINTIDIDEIFEKYNNEELINYKTPNENKRDIICLKKDNDYLATDCHIILSHAKDKDGYAEMSFDNKRGKIRIHRFIFETFNGEIEDGNVIRHMCNNPSCCNPKHLKQGTPKENSMDMVNSGRSLNQTGSKNHTSVLTENEVYQIKKLYKDGTKVKELVNIFGRNRSTINNVVHEYQWTHVKVI